jgi:fatty acid desaturase
MSKTDKFKLPPDTLKHLSRRSDFKGLMQLAGHLAALLLAGLGMHYLQGSFWFVPLLLIYSVLLIFLFAPLHESIHFTPFKTRWINNAVAAVIGFLLIIPFQYFRGFHYAHHRYTQDPERDPELVERGASNVGQLLYLSGLIIWWAGIKALGQHALGGVPESYLEARLHKAIIKEARVHVALYLLLFLLSLMYSSTVLWWYWVLPALLGQPCLRLFLRAEHGGCDFSANMLENSRTTYTTPLLNFLAWNMPYHAEHHFLASIPFHALPSLHAYTGQRVKFKGDGYYRVNREIGFSGEPG